jgi:iron complex outermembrane receptor protein
VAGTSNLCALTPIAGCTGAFYNPDAVGAGFYDVTGDVDNLGTRTFNQAAGKIAYDFGFATLQSISSYTYTRFVQNSQDNDNTPFPLQSSSYPQFQKAFTQELQLASDNSSDIQWIVGGFYYWDRSTFDGLDAFRGIRVASQPAGIFGSSGTDSFAIYAQGTAELFPAFNLTVGARYTWDHRDFTTQNLFRGTFSPVFTDDKSWSALTGRLAIDYHITDDIMIYAAYNRGFKSGVYNLAGFGPGALAPPIPPVDPEKLDAYSAGFKAELFDHRVRFNVEGFFYDYRNIQLFNVVPAGTELRNAAGAHIYGIDVDLTVVPVRHLTLNFSAEFLDGHYTSFPAGQAYFTQPPNPLIPIPPNGCPAIGASPAVPPYPIGGTNPIIQRGCALSGQDTIQSPPFSFNVSATYDVPTSWGNLDFTAIYAHRDRYFFEADNTFTSRQPASDVINASAGWMDPSDTYGFRLWVNNLTDEQSYTYIAPSASVGVRYAPRPPRTYGVTLSAHF